MPSFEDKYPDVLQNVEMAIVGVYREHKDLLDYDVDRVLNQIWTEYRNEQAGKTGFMEQTRGTPGLFVFC